MMMIFHFPSSQIPFLTLQKKWLIDSSQIAALRKNGLNEEYRARTRTFSSLDTFTVTTAKRSCSGKDTINKDGELQRLREMLDMVRSQKPDKSGDGDGDGGVSRGGEGG